jgi:mRNA interferase MazF
MIKDYFLQLLDWWQMSIVVDDRKTTPLFKEGEIWWCSVGMNIGREIFGKGIDFARPVIVLKKIDRDSFLAIPLTTQLKNGTWYVEVHYSGYERRAILAQARVFDAKRLLRKIGTLSDYNFQNVRTKFIIFYSS